MSVFKDRIQALPKTSISLLASAVIAYCQSKGYLGGDEAVLISTVLLAFGIVVNKDKFVKTK